MTVLTIILIIIGFVLIAISFSASERFTKSDESVKLEEMESKFTQYLDKDSLSKKETELIQSKVSELVEEKLEVLITNTDETLARISNEKIMALSDYSNEILAKIDKSHREVVFLYDMLGEKDEEIKTVSAQMREVVDAGTQMMDQMNRTKDEMDTAKKASEENRLAFHERAAQRRLRAAKTETSVKHTPTTQINQAAFEKVNKEQTKQVEELSQLKDVDVSAAAEGEAINHNEMILKLHGEGKSILDISKMLDLGQGEVQLVIDLFRGVKR